MSSTSLTIETGEDGITSIRFRDNSILDALAIQRIGKELADVLEVQGVKRAIIDFRDVRFLSSEALRMLLGLRSRADRAGAKVALCAIKPELTKIFKLTNLDQLFQMYPDVSAARASLGGK